MKRTGTYIKSLDQLRERETVLAKHFQGFELFVIRPVLEFQRNFIIASGVLE